MTLPHDRRRALHFLIGLAFFSFGIAVFSAIAAISILAWRIFG